MAKTNEKKINEPENSIEDLTIEQSGDTPAQKSLRKAIAVNKVRTDEFKLNGKDPIAGPEWYVANYELLKKQLESLK